MAEAKAKAERHQIQKTADANDIAYGLVAYRRLGRSLLGRANHENALLLALERQATQSRKRSCVVGQMVGGCEWEREWEWA